MSDREKKKKKKKNQTGPKNQYPTIGKIPT